MPELSDNQKVTIIGSALTVIFSTAILTLVTLDEPIQLFSIIEKDRDVFRTSAGDTITVNDLSSAASLIGLASLFGFTIASGVVKGRPFYFIRRGTRSKGAV